MVLKDSLSARSSADASGQVRVVVEPLEGHSDDEVATQLRHFGASKVERLAPGYFSARIALAHIDEIQRIAKVFLKTRKEPQVNPA